MHNSKLKRITVALCMALVPISVFAAGLGKLNVMSGLGEPLKADIELISVTPEELSSISAAIASDEAYVIQGIEKPASHNTIKVDIAKNAAGKPILKLKSSQPIGEPFLDMLIQVDWASGRLLREYTVLLDPPGYTGEADPAAQNVQAPLVKSFSKNKKANSANVTADDNIPADVMPADEIVSSNKRSKKTKPVPDVEVANDAAGEDYKTQRGDTLAKIAQDMKPDGVSLEQMLVGLYQINPNAFQGDNINRLKVGQILRQPSQDALNSISRAEAVGEIKVQTANWDAYRNKLAGIVADAAPTESEARAQSAGGKITSAQDKSETAATGLKDVVKLSAGDTTTKSSVENIKSLQDKITALQEEATAREKSVKEAQDRTADLENQIAELQKLLAIKNGAMADIQNQATDEAAKPEVIAPAAPIEVEKAAEQVKPVDSVSVEATAPSESKPKPALPEEISPVEELGFIASIIDGLNINLLAPLGGLLALLSGAWLYLRKKREKNLADFEQGIMTSGGLKANTVFGNTASASVDTGDTSFLTDFSQSANGGMIDTNDVDPIAEAEVYMAYGRDAQAEEILKDAISKEPKRHELHLKLLEMYAASINLSAFETIAGELYTSLGAEDPVWAKVAEIGIKLEPNNPLYQAHSTPGIGESLDASDFANTPLAAEKDLDFSFDNESLVQNYEEKVVTTDPIVDETALDLPQFDAETQFDAKNNAEMTPVESAEAEVVTNNALDFDMEDFGELNSNADADDGLVDNSTSLESADEASFGNTMPALDMPSFDAPKFMPEALTDISEVVADNVFDLSNSIPETEELSSFNDLAIDSIEFTQLDSPAADAEFDKEAVLDTSGIESELTSADFNSSTDFNFNIPTITPDSADNTKDNGDNSLEANVFDLNTINLEMDDGVGSVERPVVSEYTIEPDLEAPVELNNSGSEPIEVETKLDLVAAYIEMDDKEGAKELLDEVMKEGGTGQRKRAEALIAQLA